MSTKNYIENWWNKNLISIYSYLEDPERVTIMNNGTKKGTYLFSVKEMATGKLIPMYCGQTGAEDGIDRGIIDRVQEHMYKWLHGDYCEYWTGVKRSELEDGIYKFHIELVEESSKPFERRRMEQRMILIKKPYLQYGPYKKYPSRYDNLDLCIVPWKGTRRKAFLNALNDSKRARA